MGERLCRVCGCGDLHACAPPAGPCHWVEADLCSACADGGFYSQRWGMNFPEFRDRFVAKMTSAAGFDRFDDDGGGTPGGPVVDYARECAGRYFADAFDFRVDGDTPEDMALADMSYWYWGE